MRRFIAMTAVMIGIVAASASTAHADVAAAPQTDGLWVLRINDEPVSDAIVRHAEVDPAYATQAAKKADAWQQMIAAGKNPRLPGLTDAPSATQLAAVTSLRNRLRLTADANTPAKITSYDPNDPNTFQIRGNRGTGGLYWSSMILIYEAQYCSSTCEVTDRYTANVTVNPGATTTRFNGNNLYFPDSGNFQNKHFKMWAVCRGIVCSSGNTGNLPNASVDYLSLYGDRHGTVLTSAITLWVYFAPWASYQSDGGKTHDADCEAANVGNACRYSY